MKYLVIILFVLLSVLMFCNKSRDVVINSNSLRVETSDKGQPRKSISQKFDNVSNEIVSSENIGGFKFLNTNVENVVSEEVEQRELLINYFAKVGTKFYRDGEYTSGDGVTWEDVASHNFFRFGRDEMSQMDKETFEALKTVPNVLSMSFNGGGNITGFDFTGLGGSSINSFSVSNTNFDDKQLKQFMKGKTRINKVSLKNTAITEKMRHAFYSDCNIKQIELTDNKGLTVEGLNRLSVNRPRSYEAGTELILSKDTFKTQGDFNHFEVEAIDNNFSKVTLK